MNIVQTVVYSNLNVMLKKSQAVFKKNLVTMVLQLNYFSSIS